ncbi:MAG: threonine-phosphate decarboxylase CobD [Syntrophomonadaceae bacterium]
MQERIHGGNIYEMAKRYGLAPEAIIDFSASVSPLGVPEKVMAAIKAALAAIKHYPDPECRTFREMAAAYHGVNYENILAGNGAAEIIYLIAHMVRPSRALIPIPTFSEYEYAVESVGAEVIHTSFKPRGPSFFIDKEDFIKSIPDGGLAFICNPNNPTGTLWTLEDLLEIIEIGQARHCLIVVDEAYLELVENGAGYSLVGKVADYDNLLILKSLTKVYALPGLRIGYAIGSSKIIKAMAMLRDPWSVNVLAQVAGTAALQESDYLSSLQELVQLERRYLYEELGKITGLEPVYPTANFVLVDTGPAGISAGTLQKELAVLGILIRDCTSFRGMGCNHIRITVRNRPDNERLIKAAQDCLSALSGGGG